jgi:hypothetical protein
MRASACGRRLGAGSERGQFSLGQGAWGARFGGGAEAFEHRGSLIEIPHWQNVVHEGVVAAEAHAERCGEQRRLSMAGGSARGGANHCELRRSSDSSRRPYSSPPTPTTHVPTCHPCMCVGHACVLHASCVRDGDGSVCAV